MNFALGNHAVNTSNVSYEIRESLKTTSIKVYATTMPCKDGIGNNAEIVAASKHYWKVDWVIK